MTNWWQKISTTKSKQVIILSAIAFIFLGWYGIGVFGGLSDSSDMDALSSQSAKADEIIQKQFGEAPDSQVILFTGVDDSLGKANSPEYQAEVTQLLKPLESKTSSIMTYATTGSDNFISHDKTMTYAVVNMEGETKEVFETLTDFSKNTDQSKLTVQIGGSAALIEEMNAVVTGQLAVIELISLPILLILLLFFFKSAVAALVPLGIAVATVFGAFAIARFLAQFVVIDSYAVNVITILGLGLSIDYALLSVNRFREELPKGVNHAVKTMIATSGHTIVFSGITVMVCLLALLVFPFDIMHSIAIGGASAVLVAMATTYIVLPSVLKLVGHKINSASVRKSKNTKTVNKLNTNSFWYKIARFTTDYPVRTLLVGLVVTSLALIPLMQFKPGNMNYQWLARGTESQQVLEIVNTDFPASTPDLTAVMILDKQLSSTERIAESCEVVKSIQDISGVQSVLSGTPVSEKLPCEQIQMMASYNMLPPELQAAQGAFMREGALKFDVFLDDLSMKQQDEALAAMRNLQSEGGKIYVTGIVAHLHDSNRAYIEAAPWAIGIIAVAMVLLLSFALRSIVVPIQAVVINSIGLLISLSIVVGVFQLGWFSTFTGWPQVEGIVLAAPILVAAITFGLAMDYSVFLYARMRENYDRTGDSKEAVIEGIVKTGPIITAAAAALFVVVVGFLFSSVLFMQIIGLGMAIAVIVDAFFVRLVLVPSIMALVGKHSWR